MASRQLQIPGGKYNRSNNAAIIFITSNNRVLLVRERRTREWCVPGGKIDRNESDFEGALREFREETSFDIEPEFFTSIKSYLKQHGNGSITKIYIIHSTQQFPPYNPHIVLNGETDQLIFLKLDDLRNLIFKGTPHGKVNKLRQSNFNSLKDLFDSHLI